MANYRSIYQSTEVHDAASEELRAGPEAPRAAVLSMLHAPLRGSAAEHRRLLGMDTFRYTLKGQAGVIHLEPKRRTAYDSLVSQN